MTRYGYTTMCEQSPPDALVDDFVAAERAGFDFSVRFISWAEEELLPAPRGYATRAAAGGVVEPGGQASAALDPRSPRD